MLMQQVPLIIKATSKQMKVIDYKVKQAQNVTRWVCCCCCPGQKLENATRCARSFD